MPAGEPAGASCVQKSDDSRFCNSHCLSHFAAFFIVMGTKISIVENLDFMVELSYAPLRELGLCGAATAALRLRKRY